MRRSPGLMGSVRPSPAKTSFSSTLKLPPSRVSALVFFNHRPRKGRPEPLMPFQSDTFSASISVCAIGATPTGSSLGSPCP
jgi:hypothetical protein